MKKLEVIAAQYAEDYKVRITFADHTWQLVDFKPFLFAFDRGYYNRYRKLSLFKKFKVAYGTIVWGRNWDLTFRLEHLYKGKIIFAKKKPTPEELVLHENPAKNKRVWAPVTKVKFLHDYTLEVTFSNRVIRKINFHNFLFVSFHPQIMKYRDKKLFKQVKVDYGTLVWNDEMDLSPESIYNWKE